MKDQTESIPVGQLYVTVEGQLRANLGCTCGKCETPIKPMKIESICERLPMNHSELHESDTVALNRSLDREGRVKVLKVVDFGVNDLDT